MVPAAIARTNARDEKLIECIANHPTVCILKQDEQPFREVADLARQITVNAPQIISEQNTCCETIAPLTSAIPLTLGIDTAPPAIDLESLLSHSTIQSNRTPLSAEDSQDIEIVSSTRTGPAAPNSVDTTAGSTQGSIEMIPLPTSFEPIKKNPKLPCYSLDPHKPNDDFFGRQHELKLIDQTFFPDPPPLEPSDLRSFAICGMGGMGKTQIAVEYVFTRKSRFEAIFWLHADDANVLAEQYAQIAQDLELEVAEGPGDHTASRETVKGWLSNPVRSFDSNNVDQGEVSWLLIFDNVDNLNVIQDYWPATGLGSILVTSKDPLAKTSFYTANHGINLQPLSLEETAEFIRLLTKTTTAVKKEDLASLADTLAGLPLAIVQMAGVIRRDRLSYSDFLKVYKESKESQQILHNAGIDKPRPGYNHSLATVWALDRLSAEANGLLQLMSLMDPDRIPEMVFTDRISDLHLAEMPSNLLGYYKARKVLTQSSLVTHNEDRGEMLVHRLLQDATKSKMSSKRYIQIFGAACQMFHDSWPFESLAKRHNTARWKQCANLFPSIARLKNVVHEISNVSNQKPHDSFAALLNDAGW